jgi:hypothetical protein
VTATQCTTAMRNDPVIARGRGEWAKSTRNAMLHNCAEMPGSEASVTAVTFDRTRFIAHQQRNLRAQLDDVRLVYGVVRTNWMGNL